MCVWAPSTGHLIHQMLHQAMFYQSASFRYIITRLVFCANYKVWSREKNCVNKKFMSDTQEAVLYLHNQAEIIKVGIFPI